MIAPEHTARSDFLASNSGHQVSFSKAKSTLEGTFSSHTQTGNLHVKIIQNAPPPQSSMLCGGFPVVALEP